MLMLVAGGLILFLVLIQLANWSCYLSYIGKCMGTILGWGQGFRSDLCWLVHFPSFPQTDLATSWPSTCPIDSCSALLVPASLGWPFLPSTGPGIGTGKPAHILGLEARLPHSRASARDFRQPKRTLGLPSQSPDFSRLHSSIRQISPYCRIGEHWGQGNSDLPKVPEEVYCRGERRIGDHIVSTLVSVHFWLPPIPLFAGVDVINPDTFLAADITAPVEDAMALLLPLLCPGVVATATAEQITPVDPMWSHVACSVPRAKWTSLRVGLTEVGWVLIVDQVTLCWWLEEGILGPQCLNPPTGFSVFLYHHFRSTVILVLQVVTNGPEIRLSPPARFNLTTAGEAMTLAFQVHVIQDCLSRTKRNT